VTAYGHAEIKAKPDIAYVEVGVISESRDQAEAVQSNASTATAVASALNQAGIAQADIETEAYGVEPQYDYNASPPVLTGYQVTNTMRVTVRDLSKTGLVIDRATKAGASRIDGVSFDLADRAKTEDAALAAAVRSACEKAGGMADVAGATLGRLISLTEGLPVESVPTPIYGMRAMGMEAPSAPQTPIAPEQIVVTADVTVVYAVGPPKT
jgi:uncharacterized protein YggE